MEPILVTTTLPTRKEAESLAEKIVKERLAGCINIMGPITSVYFWEGKVEKQEEFKLFIKTSQEKWIDLETFIQVKHPYSVPEISRIEIRDMHEDYLLWLEEYLCG